MAKKQPSKSAPSPNKTVLVVDDHPLFRAGVVGLVQQEPDLMVSAEVDNAARALEAIERGQPDIVLMDMGLPDKSGLELLKDVRAMYPDLRVLVISMHDETLYAERVIRAGGRGYIMKQEGAEKILEAIRKVLGGGIYVSENIASLIVDSLAEKRAKGAEASVARLSDREFEILRLIGRGIEAHDIARQLHLSIKTVDTHRGRIKEKLRLKNGTELIHYAVRWLGEQV